MIVQDVMTTKMVTVAPDDTLGHAANLFRQYQFHHLPVVRTVRVPMAQQAPHSPKRTVLVLEGMLTAQDIDMEAQVTQESASSGGPGLPWQERQVSEVMHRALIRVAPTTSVAAAAQILVERGLNYLPVVEYDLVEQEMRTILVGLLTRSDLLIALARALGVSEPGMQINIALPLGNMKPLAETLRIASELRIQIRSIIATPLTNGVPHAATVRLGTENPVPLLIRLKGEGIQYSFVHPLLEDGNHA
jgi:acetoin utilization protein AcuB